MTEETQIPPQEPAAEEQGPVFYNPKTLTLMSSLSSIFSWVVLVAFLADVVAQFISVKSTLAQQGMTFDVKLFQQPSAVSFLVSNLSTPLFTGITFFLLLQGVSIALNVLLEIAIPEDEE